MSGICSKHQGHDRDCDLCNAPVDWMQRALHFEQERDALRARCAELEAQCATAVVALRRHATATIGPEDDLETKCKLCHAVGPFRSNEERWHCDDCLLHPDRRYAGRALLAEVEAARALRETLIPPISTVHVLAACPACAIITYDAARKGGTR